MTFTPFVPHTHLDALIAMVIQAGHMARDIYQTYDHGVEIKDDKSPVTRADKLVEAYLEQQLSELTPHIPIIGEEGMAFAKDAGGVVPHNYEQFWLLDPIDGTQDFIERTGAYAINVALVEWGVPVLGMIYAPSYHNQLFVGGVGVGVFRYDGHTHTRHDILACDICPLVHDKNGTPILRNGGLENVSDARNTVPNPLIVITSGRNKDRYKIQDWLTEPLPHGYMKLGSAIKFTLLASNQAHVYPRFAPSMEWDTASGDVILRQLGGGIYTLDGKLMTYGKPDYRNSHFISYAPIMPKHLLKF